MNKNMVSNFEKVVEFNYAFGVLKSKELIPNQNIFSTPDGINEVNKCFNLVDEEARELKEAIDEKDSIKILDALGDLLYVTYGMCARSLGVNADKAFDLIHKNNMTKLCKTEEEAQITVEYYKQNIQKLGYDSPTYRKANDNIHWVVFNEKTGKVLKSIMWKDVDLTSVFN